MTPAVVSGEVARLKSIFVLLPEMPAIYPVWESLVMRYQVCGKPAHDARLVAAMKVHGLSAILSFDRTGFSRFADIEVIHPSDVVAGVTGRGL
jgi:predicted nucleic acid-binding protein